MERHPRSARTLSRGVLALLVAGSIVALAPSVASARWQIHNGADATQMVPAPDGNDTHTCADALHGQSAWTTVIPVGGDPDPSQVTFDSTTFATVTYEVYKRPPNVPDVNDAYDFDFDGDGDLDVVFDDSTGQAVPAIFVETFVTDPRTAPPAPGYELVYPPFDPTTDNTYLYSLVSFDAPIPQGTVVPGDVLVIRPLNANAFYKLTVIDCAPAPVTARIDVLPGSSTNVIHPKVKLPLIPVLVYGSNALRVRSIVKSSVRLKNAPAADVSATQSRLFDADHDGKLDRKYYFSPVKTGITCGQTSVTLTGRTKTGIHFTGTNPIRTVC
jgi:hypothetical protein